MSPVQARGADWDAARLNAEKKLNSAIGSVNSRNLTSLHAVNVFYDATVQHRAPQTKWTDSIENQIFKQEFGTTPAQIRAGH